VSRKATGSLPALAFAGALFGIAAGAEIPAQTRSAKDGVFTTAQADAGKAVYAGQCASCHGTMAGVTPDMAPLLNDHVFQDTWKDRSVGDLFERIRTTMPQNGPGTLSPRHTSEIVAYILSANRLPAGESALSEDVETLKQIRMDVAEP
jgi:quinoprotein glucose dehydrogenase